MESIIDCNKNCFLCEKKQAWKVDLQEFHGVCDDHNIEESQIYECIRCKILILTSKFTYIKSIKCDHCYTNSKICTLSCNHNICEICFKEANYRCPLCLFNLSENFINQILNKKAPIELPKYQVHIEEKEEISDKNIDLKYIKNEKDLHAIDDVKLLQEDSMAFDNHKPIQSESIDSQSQPIKSIEIPLPQIPIPQQEFIYKKCPKCASGILVELDTYKEVYKCSSCDKLFCIFCLELLKHPSSQHPCTKTTKKLVNMPRKEFNKKNKELKKRGLMLQACPFCKDMREYRIEKGYYICCENPIKCEIMFCLSCGDAINENDTETFVNHFYYGSNHPCVDFEIAKKYQLPIIYQYDRLKIYKS